MNLDAQIAALETNLKLKQRDARILKLSRELEAARRYIHALTRSARVNDDRMELDEEEDAEDTLGLPQVLISGGVYVCYDCGTEVLDGVCHNYNCGKEHQWPPEKPLGADYSLNTESLAAHPHRSLVPRGDTPIRDLDSIKSDLPPDEYRNNLLSRKNGERHRSDRSEEYWQLIARGATRLMCETFHLEYTHEGGIYAWADSGIFDEFSGPLMQLGHTWKIHLGRRIELEEGDWDGSGFIEDLLEDAVMFPTNIVGFDTTRHEWETKEETLGVWVTRLKAPVEDKQDEDDDSDNDDSSAYYTSQGLALERPLAAGAIALNEYLSDSADEEDCNQPADAMSEDDSDDYASPNSCNSDSEDAEVYDTALVSLTGPDRVWDSDMEDTSEDEEPLVLDGKCTQSYDA